MPNTSRRKFLRGLGLGAGVPLLSPICHNLAPEALGQEVRTRRLVIYLGGVSTSNGNAANPGYAPIAEATPSDFRFNDGFSPLAPQKKHILFLTGLYNRNNPDLHGPAFPLTAAPGRPGGISLDRLVASTVGKDAPISSLNLAMTVGSLKNGVFETTNSSADGPGKVFPPEIDPLKAYEAVFSGGASGAGSASGPSPETIQRLANRRSVLDRVRADVTKLNGRLAGSERAKLDQYFESLRAMEIQMERLARGLAGCNPGARPSATTVRPTLAQDAIITAHTNVAVNALICGLTRVALLSKFSSSYLFLGASGGAKPVGHHGFWHGDGNPGPDGYRKYYQYHAKNFVSIRDRLSAVSEGNGTMADSTLLMMTERSGMRHHNGSNQLFIILLGNPAGTWRTGRLLPFQQKHSVADAYVSILNAMGVSVDTFGSDCKGPLPGLT